MSSLDDRSESPRRRIDRGMHPGWACFLCAWFSGIVTVLTGLYLVLHPAEWGFLIYAGIAMGLFIAGGRKAEKLTDRG